MRFSYKKTINLVLLSTACVLLSAPVSADFPEFPFCPLGGPPGWANRMFDLDDDYPPPAYYYGAPYWQGYPAYPPAVYPAYPRPGYQYPQSPPTAFQGG